MSRPGCSRPLDPMRLLEFWLRELGEAADARVEEHLLACADCSRSLQDLLDLGAAVRACVRRGLVRAVINDTFVWRLMGAGLRVREYRVPRDGSVQCTVAPEDDVVIARLEAPLAGVERLDVVMMGVEGGEREVLDDVPFDPEAGELLIAPDIEQLRALPASTAKMHLVAVDENARRVIGEYTFVHTPWGQ
ncbi:MAG TPA: hypothetical protein VL049_23740 [Candidatus Dormibacteraeota bacterium]|nr:hypothetical protein [Candidatus Dormibacteraeota bacterium]